MSEIDLKPTTALLQWSEEDVVNILKQFNRKPTDLTADVATIRDWLKTQPHLPLQPSDHQIVHFLLLNKFSFEKTKKKLEMYYTIKSIAPEFFAIPPLDARIEESMNAYNGFPLSHLSKDCNRIIINKCQNADKVNVCTLLSYIAFIYDLRSIYDFYSSDDFIIDMQNINISLISKLNFVEVRKGVAIWENVYSTRINAVHVINLPKFAESLANFLKSLFKEKIQKRIYFHKSVEELWEFYPKEILPKEMGGTKPLAVINREWMEIIKENSNYLDEMRKARIVEELRPQRLVNDDILGYHGSFRKLEID